MSKINYVVLIPAYNPDDKFIAFSKILRENNIPVIAIDDGSKAECNEIFKEIENMGCILVRHEVNKGKGQALRTGFAKVIELNNEGADYEYVITADCDGQHSFDAIQDVVKEAEESANTAKGPAIIIGGRFKDDKDVIPLKSRIGNGFTRGVFKIATGISIYDTQTGLRAIPKRLFNEMLKIKGDRYEYEMNMLLQISTWGVPYKEIPIKTIYFDNNAGTNFHPMRDSFLVISQILKYIASSLASVVIDYILFIILTRFSSVFHVGVAYAVARLLSGCINYLLNASIVFHKVSKVSAVKYFLLSLTLTLFGSLVSGYISELVTLPDIIYKLVIDIPLFFISYYVQKRIVFRK